MRTRHPFAIVIVLVLLATSARSASTARTRQLLIASDLHFNPFADTALAADLAAAPARRWEEILNQSKPAAYSPYGQDTNWWLLQSALDAMRTTLPHPALVMITGDLLAHGFPQAYAKAMHDSDRQHYRAFVRKTVEFLGWELRRRFDGAQILLTPGNNDNECGDYDIEADGPFLSDTADLAGELAGAGGKFSKADWKALGSYAIEPRASRSLRILSVNSVFFSNKYQAASFANACSPVDSTAAARTFTWLESNLAQARLAHKKVWLMLHIPPGIDGYSTMMQYRRLATASPKEDLCGAAIVPMWKPIWTTRFDGLLREYQSTVAATFAGHDHTDDFRVIDGGEAGGAFVLIDPPISPIYGQNPAFRVVTFGDDGALAGQSTYYLTNLPAAGSTTPGRWMREYSFMEEWHARQLDAGALKSIYGRIRSDATARDRWLTLLNVSSPHDVIPVNGVGALDCAIAGLDPASYRACYCPVPAP